MGMTAASYDGDPNIVRNHERNFRMKIDTFEGLRPWLETRLGYSLDRAAADSVTVLPNREQEMEPLLALKIGESGVIRVRPAWVESIQRVTEGLALDELFSVFGAYELARVTLGEDIGVWGPSWYFVGDEAHFKSEPEQNVTHLSSDEVDALADRDVFWHCNWHDASASFGVLDQGKLVALCTVEDVGTPMYEFSVDVAPDSGRRRLGQAVVGAAGRWILRQGGLILATTAPWNIPSARLLRSVGLCYVLCDMVGKPGLFRVPPQPLGKPLMDTALYNLYPDWAMNTSIRPRP